MITFFRGTSLVQKKKKKRGVSDGMNPRAAFQSLNLHRVLLHHKMKQPIGFCYANEDHETLLKEKNDMTSVEVALNLSNL